MTGRHRRDDTQVPAADPLVAVCELARWSHRAAAVSVAVVTDDGLEYVASSGAGAAEIVGTVLTPGQGLAGFVAATGQSLAVRDAVADPRFARDVAERTGYVPKAIQIMPILDGGDGEVVGVMSMLDRGHHEGAPDDPPVALAGFADIAGPLLPHGRPDGDGADVVARLERLDPADRTAATTAIAAVLDAIER